MEAKGEIESEVDVLARIAFYIDFKWEQVLEDFSFQTVVTVIPFFSVLIDFFELIVKGNNIDIAFSFGDDMVIEQVTVDFQVIRVSIEAFNG